MLKAGGPCLLFLNHTVDDFLALAVILCFLTRRGKKICVLQRETGFNHQSLFAGDNIMFCNVLSKYYLDQLNWAVNDRRLIAILPDTPLARYNTPNNHINVSRMFGREVTRHPNPLVSNLLQRDICIYKKELCKMSKLFKMGVTPISGLLKSNTFELKVHPGVKPFEGQGEVAKDNFMRLIYDEKVDYLVKSFERYTLLEGHLHTHAWSNSGVLDHV